MLRQSSVAMRKLVERQTLAGSQTSVDMQKLVARQTLSGIGSHV